MKASEAILLVISVVLLAAPSYSLGDVLVTRGGERLVGQVVQESADQVIFKSDAFGEMRIPRDAIATLTRTPATTTASSRPADTFSLTAPPQPTSQPQRQKTPEEEHGPVASFLIDIYPLKHWKTSLDIGWNFERGTDNENHLLVNFRTSRRKAPNEFQIGARYEYGQDVFSDGTKRTTDDLVDADFLYRRDLGGPFFAQSNSRYYRDTLKDLEHEVTQTVGIGYRIFDQDGLHASIAPAMGAQWKKVTGVEEGTNFVAGVYQDFDIHLTRKLTLRQSLYYLVAPQRPEDYSVRGYVELSHKLSSVLSAGIRYDLTYDGEVGRDALEFKQTLSLTLGMSF